MSLFATILKVEKRDDYDELIRDLIPWYLASEKEDLILLETALSKKDFATLVEIGDKMYGHGRTYGFPFITMLGKRIEIAAIQGNILMLSELIASLRNYLQDCCRKYKLD